MPPQPCDAGTPCPSSGVYSASVWIGNLDHLIVKKADPARDVCVEIFADAPAANTQGFDFTAPQQYGVSFAWISNKASDCASMQPSGTMATAKGGKGTLTWTLMSGMHYPCTLAVDAVLLFDATQPWMQPMEPMSASGVTVSGGCM
jgi:hypothetical protein